AVAPVDVERRDLAAEIARPDFLACHVDGDELACSEHRVDALSIRNGTRARQVVFVVDFDQPTLRCNLVQPDASAVLEIQCFDQDAAVLVRRLSGGERPSGGCCVGALAKPWSDATASRTRL